MEEIEFKEALESIQNFVTAKVVAAQYSEELLEDVRQGNSRYD